MATILEEFSITGPLISSRPLKHSLLSTRIRISVQVAKDPLSPNAPFYFTLRVDGAGSAGSLVSQELIDDGYGTLIANAVIDDTLYGPMQLEVAGADYSDGEGPQHRFFVTVLYAV